MFYIPLTVFDTNKSTVSIQPELALKWVVGLAILSGLFCIAYAVYYWKFISGRNKATIDKCKRWITIGVFLCLVVGTGYVIWIYLFS